MRIAIVTGASSGMGREFAIRLSRVFEVDEIWVVARRMARLDELEQLCGLPIQKLALDLSKSEELDKFRQKLETEQPTVKVLVNAAGFGNISDFAELSYATNLGMVEVNCNGLTAMTAMCLPYMKDGGNIINLASAAAFLPQPRFAVYAATKAYVLSLSQALAKELKPRNIKVCAVCPGPVKTEFFDVATTTGEVAVYKKLFMAEASKVVEKSLRAAKRGRTVYTNGFAMKLLRVLAKILPNKFMLLFVR